MKADHVFSVQTPEAIKRHPGPVVWINRCENCGQEEPVYQGPVEVALFQSKLFIKRHRTCKGKERPG